MLILCTEVMDQLIRHAQACYPDEACGLLIGEKGKDSVNEFIPVKNIYNEMHERYPETYPRDAKTAYLIDPREQQRIFDEAGENGREVKAIFHSHTDHDAYFSQEDRLVATPWGEPAYPGVSYIVVSIRNRSFKGMNEFVWDEKKKDFVERKIK